MSDFITTVQTFNYILSIVLSMLSLCVWFCPLPEGYEDQRYAYVFLCLGGAILLKTY